MPVTRPYPRTAPCAIACRGDGDQVAALIGPEYQGGVVGFGDTLPDALRDLADSLEKEVEYEGEQVTEITDTPQEPRVLVPRKRMDWAGIRRDHATDHIWAMEDRPGLIGLRVDCGDGGAVYFTPDQARDAIAALETYL